MKDVSADMEEMETEASEKKATTSSEEKFTMKKLLTSVDLRMPVIITVMLQVAQQFSGINCVCIEVIFFVKQGEGVVEFQLVVWSRGKAHLR